MLQSITERQSLTTEAHMHLEPVCVHHASAASTRESIAKQQVLC